MAALILLLAQTCVAEISLQKDPSECAVMWSINARTAERRQVTLKQQTLEYNAYWDKRSKDRRLWIGNLKDSYAMPEGWPGSEKSWKARAGLWMAYLDKAVEFILWPPERLLCPRAGSYGGTPGDGIGADDEAPCPEARRVRCMRGELQAYWNVTRCFR